MSAPYREPTTGAYSLYPNPTDHSTDNGVLFTAVAVKLGLITVQEFLAVMDQYLDPNGYLLRYPGTTQYASYDDHVGACGVSLEAGKHFASVFQDSDYTQPDGNWLGRFPILEPTIRASAALLIAAENEGKAIGCFAENAIFDPDTETSGKQLLWMSTGALKCNDAVGVAIALWQARMAAEYSLGGLSQMLAIYYPAGHPFIAAAARKPF